MEATMATHKKTENNPTSEPNTNPISSPVVGVSIYEKIYAEDLSFIQAVVRDKYFNPTNPIDIYLEEGEGVYEFLTRKLSEMEGKGFDPEIATLFYRRIAAARTAQTMMKTNMNEEQFNKRTFKELNLEATALKEKIFDRLKILVKKHPEHAEKIDEISKNNRISDTIQDLFELGKVGEQLFSGLEKMKVTAEDLTRAKELANTLGRIHTSSHLDGKVHSESRVIRDKAITLMEESHDEIKEWAKIIYKRDTQTLNMFFSKYKRAQSRKNNAKRAEQVEPINTTQTLEGGNDAQNKAV